MSKSLTSFVDNAAGGEGHPQNRAEEVVLPEGLHSIASDIASASLNGAWRELLSETITREVLPRLLLANNLGAEPSQLQHGGEIDAAAIAGFVQLIIDDDVEQMRALADRVILYAGGREALLSALLKPAADLLGVMWERDDCDFMAVTLGVYRLNQIMRETASAGSELLQSSGFEHRILLSPAPGDQHSFGAAMVADAFREGGWCVRSAPAVTRGQLLRLIKDEWFDAVGLSVSSERWLKGLPSCIRAVRSASCNPNMFIMLGGYAINNNAERTRFLGADGTATDAGEALKKANIFMDTTVTRQFCQYKTSIGDVS